MGDLRLMVTVAKGAGAATRDRLLVLLSSLLGWPVERLLQMKLRDGLYQVRRGVGTPFADLVRGLLGKLRDGGMGMDDLLFPSRKGTQAIGRIQAWRIVSRALASVGMAGAFGLLRSLFTVFCLPRDEEVGDVVEALASCSRRTAGSPSG